MATPGTINVAQYRRIVVLTGAGSSVRLWVADLSRGGRVVERRQRAAVRDCRGGQAGPAGCLEFFAQMRTLIAEAVPSVAHRALARLAETLTSGQALTILTQNVDGLQQLAGSKAVVELHGSLHRSRCTRCDYSRSENLALTSAECPECPSSPLLLPCS